MPKRVAVEEWKKYKCVECDKEIDGTEVWEKHLKSKKHLKRTSKKQSKL